MCGYGRFGRELTADLRAAGLEVTIIEPARRAAERRPGCHRRRRIASREVLARADLAGAVGLVAGTDNDTTNLSMLANARRMNPKLFLAARQNRPTSAALFEAMQVDALLVPTEVVAHEVYAQISTPLLWRFIQGMPAEGDEWAADLIERLRHNCGRRAARAVEDQAGPAQAPASRGRLADGAVLLGDLLRSPEDRERRLEVVPLLLLRGGDAILTPGDDTVLDARRRAVVRRAKARSAGSWRARWWSTRPARTCSSTSASRQLGLAQAVPEGHCRTTVTPPERARLLSCR